MIETQALLALQAMRGIGPKTIHLLLLQEESLEADVARLHRALERLGQREKRVKAPSQDVIKQAIAGTTQTLQTAQEHSVTILGWGDAGFPPHLKTIPNPPVVLYAKGNLACLQERGVAVVGTREPTSYGMTMAERCGKVFAEHGHVVVSGLAAGCDTGGHLGCLTAHGRTVAVLAHGLDTVYPAANKTLAARILTEDGCLLSEYPIGERTQRSNFVHRDRLQSGLSAGVVVIETDEQGGTMHTVGFAEAQQRVLACLVHPPKYQGEAKARGTQMLLREGRAMPLGNEADIEAFLHRCFPSTPGVEASSTPPATVQKTLL